MRPYLCFEISGIASASRGLTRPASQARSWLLVLAVVCMICPALRADIAPFFTPIDLYESSELILVVRITPPSSKMTCTATVERVLKGNTELRTITMDFSDPAPKDKDHRSDAPTAKLLEHAVGDPVPVFVGENELGEHASLVYVVNTWCTMHQKNPTSWAFEMVDDTMYGTWEGGPAMLIRCMEYIRDDEDAHVPIRSAVEMDDVRQLGRVAGRAHDLQAVRMSADGPACLFVASEGGDRLYAYDPAREDYTDITDARRLRSRSRVAVWGDFDGDGRLDLAGCGDAPGIWFQETDGSLGSHAKIESDTIKGRVTGLAALDMGSGPGAALLVSTSAGPVLLEVGDGRALTAGALPRNETAAAEPGTVTTSLVADFNGDALPDILQLYARGSVLYRGRSHGGFESGTRCAVAIGKGRASATVGDWDGDGMFDVLCVAEDEIRIWQNSGGTFTEVLEKSGMIRYVTKPGGVGCGVCDIDGDGRQDVYLLYDGMAPQLFFGNGFRSFGLLHELFTTCDKAVSESLSKGQQAGIVADVDGDGMQELTVVLRDGRVMSLFNRKRHVHGISMHAELPPGGRRAGPVPVAVWNGKRCMGAWNVTAGSTGAFISILDPGPVTIKWPGRDGRTNERTLVALPLPKTVQKRKAISRKLYDLSKVPDDQPVRPGDRVILNSPDR